MSAKPTGAAPVNLQAAKVSRLGAALLPLLTVYEPATLLDAIILLKVASQPDIGFIDLANEYGMDRARIHKTVYGLEKGRGDQAGTARSSVKALGLLEVRADNTPGRRHMRMIRLTGKGARVVGQMLKAMGG